MQRVSVRWDHSLGQDHCCRSSFGQGAKQKRPAFRRAFFGTAYGAGTRSRTRDLLITSQLLYQLSYTGVMAAEYTEPVGLVKPSCLIRLKKTSSGVRPRLALAALGRNRGCARVGRFLAAAGIWLRTPRNSANICRDIAGRVAGRWSKQGRTLDKVSAINGLRSCVVRQVRAVAFGMGILPVIAGSECVA